MNHILSEQLVLNKLNNICNIERNHPFAGNATAGVVRVVSQDISNRQTPKKDGSGNVNSSNSASIEGDCLFFTFV